MAYQRIYRCPYCNAVIRRLSGPLLLGTPFQKCKKCGKDIVDTSTEEWVSKSIYGKWACISSVPSIIAFAASFVIALILMLANLLTGGGTIALFFVLFFVLEVGLSILNLFFRMKKDILASLERTTHSDYVNALIKANFKIRSVKDFELKLVLPKESNIEEFKQKLKLAGVKVQESATTENATQSMTTDVTNNIEEQAFVENSNCNDNQVVDTPNFENAVFEELVATEILDSQIQNDPVEDEDELIDVD